MSQLDPAVKRPFELPLVTRGYECDPTKTLPIPVLFSYLEQCRWDWIAHPAFGLVEHIHQGHFFVVHEQTLAIRRRVGMGVPVKVRGVLERAARCIVQVRQDVVREEDGATLATARVKGVWIGPERKMVRLPPKTLEAARWQRELGLTLDEVPVEEEPATRGGRSFLSPDPVVIEPMSVEISPPHAVGKPSWSREIEVRPSDIDIFDHVNAATYLRYFDDTLRSLPELGDDAAWPSVRASLKYQAEAVAGDVVVAKAWRLDEPHAFGLQLSRDHEPLCWARIDTRPR